MATSMPDDRFKKIEEARSLRLVKKEAPRRFTRKCDVCRLRLARWLTKGVALLCPVCARELYPDTHHLAPLR